MGSGSDKQRKRLISGFYKNHPAAYEQLLELLDSRETPRLAVFEKIGEAISMKGTSVKKVMASLRNLKSRGISIAPPENQIPRVRIRDRKQERLSRREMNDFKRKSPTIFNELHEILKKGEKLTDETIKHILRDDMKMRKSTLIAKFRLMRRQCKGGGNEDEKREVEPSTSGSPSRGRRDESSETGDRMTPHYRSENSNSPEPMDLDPTLLSEPSMSQSAEHRNVVSEGDDWLELDPRTRSAVGNTERRSRQAEKISVQRTISTTGHCSSGSPNAPEALGEKQVDLGTGESMPHVTDEPAIQSIGQQPEDVPTQNVLAEATVQTQRTVVSEEQPQADLEQADSEMLSTLHNVIGAVTVEHQQQDEETRPLLETQLSEDHTRSQVNLVNPQSMIQGTEVPEEQQSNSDVRETTVNTHRSPSTNTFTGHVSIFKDIEDALGFLDNSLSQLKYEDVIEMGRFLQFDMVEMKCLLQRSTILKKSSREQPDRNLQEIFWEIERCLVALGSDLNELKLNYLHMMSDELRLDLRKVQMMLANWNGNGDGGMVGPGAEAIKQEEMEVEGVQVKTEDPEGATEYQHQGGAPANQPEPQIKIEPEDEA